jgi:thiol-disulfide isomerase/thioredoxin
MTLFGLLALAYVLLQTFSVPKNNLERFAEGSLRKLVVLENPPEQSSRLFKGPDGQEMNLASFRGKIILLNVWATWCAPCVAEIPSLDQLQKEQGNEQFEVVAVSQDMQAVDAESFLRTKNIEHLSFYHDNTLGLASDVEVAGLPISIFYDANGSEIARIPGEVNWQSAEVGALLREILSR